MRFASIILSICLVSAGQPGGAAETAFDEKVRDYILRHPEVIMEALAVLAEREQAAELARRIAAQPGLFQQTTPLGIGPQDAPMRIIEFFDYKCAPCKALHPKLTEALAGHPNLRVEMRHLPILTPASERAARFALAVRDLADDGAYRRVHDALWRRVGPISATFLNALSEAEHLNYADVEAAMYAPSVTDRIAANRDAAIALEIVGTPAFVTQRSVSVGSSDAEALVAGWLSQ